MKFKTDQANTTYSFLIEELNKDMEALEKQWYRENPKSPKTTLMLAMNVIYFERLQTIINTAEDVDIKERSFAGNMIAYLLEEEKNKKS